MNVLTAVNENYLEPLSVMLYSLCANNPCAVSIYIFHFDISEQARNRFVKKISGWGYNIEANFKQCDRKRFENILCSSRYGHETNLRLLLLDMLPESMDRILWLDTDIIVKGDISRLYNYEDKGQCALVCRDMFAGIERRETLFRLQLGSDTKYFNAGVMLFYLKNVRKHFSPESFLQWMNENPDKLNYPDQNTLNVCLKGKAAYARSEIYNLQTLRIAGAADKIRYAKIVHYNTKEKPWQSGYSGAGEKLYWRYAVKALGINKMLGHYFRKFSKGAGV